MKKSFIFFGLFLFLISGLGFFYASSQQEVPKRAPVNPAFLEYLNQVERGVYKYFSDDGHPLGYIPSPVDLSHINREVVSKYSFAAPATYDLRSTGRVTSVKDQGTCGACWAFATYGSLESWLRTGETWDFAEQYLNGEHPFDSLECVGGNAFMSDAMLTNWDGPHNESDYVYPYGYFIPYTSIEAIQVGPAQKHVQEVNWLPYDADTIKNHVMSSGAVYVYFYWDVAYYNSTYDAYYYNGGPGGNHTVCIVGWDDNFDASEFITTPSGNGAWLMKNSWGTSFGDSGYFWMSYHDSSLGGPVAFHNAEPTSNYGGIYSHDEFGWVWNFGPLGWGANMFTATSDHSIAAVGFYTNDIGTNYSVYLYTNLTDDTNPRSGTLATTKTGTMSFPGSHTVVLDSPVPVTNGSKFSVVIYLDQSYGNALAVEGPSAGYSSGCTSNAKESFYSFDGTSWTDFDTFWPDYNVLIKAFVAGTAVAVKNDFNGDGQGDILWRNYLTGQNAVWYMGDSGGGATGLSLQGLGMMMDMGQGLGQDKVYQDPMGIEGRYNKNVMKAYWSPMEAAGLVYQRQALEFDWKELGDAKEIRVLTEPGDGENAELSIQA
ncbi:lectin like domain-containing protein, partial [Acidobacteriota bacterium]